MLAGDVIVALIGFIVEIIRYVCVIWLAVVLHHLHNILEIEQPNKAPLTTFALG